jgi:hypothetical protein
MANTGFMISADQAGVATTAATSQFWPISGCLVVSNTETDLQTVVRSPGTFHNMFARVTTNAATGTNTLVFRKNAGAGNQTVNPAGTTGNFQDTTHTDACVAADKIDYNSSADSTLTTTYKLMSTCFDSTTNFSTRGVMTTPMGYTTGAQFSEINGLMGGASFEAGLTTTLLEAGTMTHLQCILTANAKTATMTFVSRLNAGAGALTTTIAASPSGTGIFEDSTHSDTIAATNTWNTSWVGGTDTTHATTWTLTSQDFNTTVGNFFLVQTGADADVAGTVSATRYAPIGGRLAFTATETDVQSNALATFNYSNMQIQQTVISTATGTFTFRKNTAAGVQTVTFGTAAGNYTDSTHTDSVIKTDNINYAVLCGATTAGSFSKCTVWGNFVPSIAQTVFIEWEE